MSIGMKRGTVYLESHQKCWEKSAESVMCDIRSALNGLDAAVEHIGSTAIRSIRAKPIVDIAVAVSDYNAVFARNVALEKAGILPQGGRPAVSYDELLDVLAARFGGEHGGVR